MLLGLMVLVFGSCKRFDVATVGVTDDPLDRKLLTLEPRAEAFGNPDRPVNELKMRLFRKELEENLMDPYGDVYGEVVITQTVIDQRARLFFPTALLLYTPMLVGFPLAFPKMEIELELRIYDAKRKLIGVYTGTGRGNVTIAMYYGYGFTGAQKMYADAINEAFDEIRSQVRRDAIRINDALERAGLRYNYHPQTLPRQQ